MSSCGGGRCSDTLRTAPATASDTPGLRRGSLRSRSRDHDAADETASSSIGRARCHAQGGTTICGVWPAEMSGPTTCVVTRPACRRRRRSRAVSGCRGGTTRSPCRAPCATRTAARVRAGTGSRSPPSAPHRTCSAAPRRVTRCRSARFRNTSRPRGEGRDRGRMPTRKIGHQTMMTESFRIASAGPVVMVKWPHDPPEWRFGSRFGFGSHCRSAVSAFVYGFAPVFNLSQVERFVTTGVGANSAAPFNSFSHADGLAGPDDTFRLDQQRHHLLDGATRSERRSADPRRARHCGCVLRAAVRGRVDQQLRLHRKRATGTKAGRYVLVPRDGRASCRPMRRRCTARRASCPSSAGGRATDPTTSTGCGTCRTGSR